MLAREMNHLEKISSTLLLLQSVFGLKYFGIGNNWETVKHVILNLELVVNKVNQYKKKQ